MATDRKELSLDVLELVSGGALRPGWQDAIDNMYMSKRAAMIKPLADTSHGIKTVDAAVVAAAEILGDLSGLCGADEMDKVQRFFREKYGVVVR